VFHEPYENVNMRGYLFLGISFDTHNVAGHQEKYSRVYIKRRANVESEI
jgi:hypothetical protein